ncbi:hypothetical protein BSKO_13047 [Bryopsis sp. KO-2023]|nr:hypothetical protein BSKO_13047 [Bryopsis sp. KO-2023]
MAFFGLTFLNGGIVNPFHDGSANTKSYPFHEIEDDVYLDAFVEHALGEGNVARQLQVDGNKTILRSKLGNVLKRVLKRQPSKLELDAWFTFLDFDSRCTMDIVEFQNGVADLKTFSSNPDSPTQYKSYDQQHVDWIKHKRVGYEPQKSLKGPVVTSQEIGWHTKKKLGGSIREHFPHHTTDVTINEGRNLADYYGHITMM